MKNKLAKNSFAMPIYFIFVALIRNQLWMLPSPLMGIISESLQIDSTQAGMLISIMTMITGIFMFVGSFIIDRIGAGNTFLIGCVCLSVEGIVAILNAPYGLILGARVISGMGYGMSAGATSVLINQRYAFNKRGIINSFNAAINSGTIGLSFIITIPIFRLLNNSWRAVSLVWSLIAMVLAAFVFINEKEHQHIKMDEYKRSSFAGIAKKRAVWCIAMATAGAVLLYNCFSIYLPMFMIEVHNVSIETAGVTSSTLSLAGLFGCFIAGLLLRYFKNIRLVMICQHGLMILSACGAVLISHRFLQTICIVLMGICFFSWTPVSVTTLMNMDWMKPRMMGAVTAVSAGTGCILVIFLPKIFGKIQQSLGIQYAMLSFCLIGLVSILGIAVIPSNDIKQMKSLIVMES